MGNSAARTGLAIVFATLAAACGDNVRNEMEATAVSEAMRPEEVDTVTAAKMAGELVDVTLGEWSITMSPAEMPAGQVTFRVRNTGQVMHDFEVESADDEWEVDGDVPPGQERTMTVTLAPGTYEVYCPSETDHGEHRELGMRTTFTVR